MANMVPYGGGGPLVPSPLTGEYLQRIRWLSPYVKSGVTIEGQLLEELLTQGLGGGRVPPSGPRASKAPNFTRRQVNTGLGKQRPIGYSVRQPPGKPFLPSNWLGKAFALGAPAAAAYNTFGATPEEIAAQSAGTGNPLLDNVGAFSTNLGSALTIGMVAPETFAATGRNIEAALSGAQMEPFTNAGREQAAALSYLQEQIADTANQIVGVESTGGDAKQLRDKHTALIMLARGIEAGTVSPADIMPGEAAPPPTNAPVSPMFAGNGGGFSLTGPYMDYSYSPTPIPAFPQMPDYSLAAPTQAPTDPNAMQNAILAGLYGGGAQTDPMASPATLLFNLGAGALTGKAGYADQQQQRADEFARDQNAFKQWLAENQASDAARRAQFDLNVAGIQQGDRQFQTTLDAKRAEQLQPKIESGYAVVPSRNGNQINYNIQPLSDKNLGLLSQYGQYMVSPQDTFDTIMSSPGGPELVDQLMQDLDLSTSAKLQSVGANDKTISNAAVSRLVGAFAQQFPQEFQQIQQEAILRKALSGAK